MKPILLPSACLVLSMLALCACKPQPPPTDEPPKPKAVATDASALHDAIQQPLDQARAVDAASQRAAEAQRAAIDAASN